jgi:large subunit ribosomal protein L6
MSRVANSPVNLPKGVEVTIDQQLVKVKGPKGQLEWQLNEKVAVSQADNALHFATKSSDPKARALAGTSRALLNNMVIGVNQGFEKKLQLVGVGYRAKTQGKSLSLELGFSHPVNYTLPEGVTAETPSATEILIKGNDKQKVGQVAAEIRSYRPPEPYKGKGVRYHDEAIIRKEAKKK